MDINTIEKRDCIRGISGLENDTIDLVVTSPPMYSDTVCKTYEDYLEFIQVTFFVLYGKVKKGGKVCVVLPRYIEDGKVRRPIFSDFINIMLDIGYLYNEDIVWDKKDREYILVFGTDDTINALEETCWKLPNVLNNNGITPYPMDLSTRLIEEYSKNGDIVLDPFMGTGTTAVSCVYCGRNYIGFDNNEDLVNLSEKRIENFKEQIFEMVRRIENKTKDKEDTQE